MYSNSAFPDFNTGNETLGTYIAAFISK